MPITGTVLCSLLLLVQKRLYGNSCYNLSRKRILQRKEPAHAHGLIYHNLKTLLASPASSEVRKHTRTPSCRVSAWRHILNRGGSGSFNFSLFRQNQKLNLRVRVRFYPLG